MVPTHEAYALPATQGKPIITGIQATTPGQGQPTAAGTESIQPNTPTQGPTIITVTGEINGGGGMLQTIQTPGQPQVTPKCVGSPDFKQNFGSLC